MDLNHFRGAIPKKVQTQALRGGVIIKKRGSEKKTKKSEIQIRTFENPWGGSQFFKKV